MRYFVTDRNYEQDLATVQLILKNKVCGVFPFSGRTFLLLFRLLRSEVIQPLGEGRYQHLQSQSNSEDRFRLLNGTFRSSLESKGNQRWYCGRSLLIRIEAGSKKQLHIVAQASAAVHQDIIPVGVRLVWLAPYFPRTKTVLGLSCGVCPLLTAEVEVGHPPIPRAAGSLADCNE